MRVLIPNNSNCGAVPIPAGEYLVALRSDIQTIQLTGAGKDIAIPAIRRRGNCKVRYETVSIYASGGRTWTILLQHPKLGEWSALIEIDVQD